jgi:outer membrane receptor protein involved in Fe transport
MAICVKGHQRFSDESLWNYEVGVKMQQRGFSLNAAAFYTKMKDLQVTLDAGSCSSRVVFNVPKAHSSGIELEMSLKPTDSLELSLSGAVLNAVFDSTVRDGSGAVLGGIRDQPASNPRRDGSQDVLSQVRSTPRSDLGVDKTCGYLAGADLGITWISRMGFLVAFLASMFSAARQTVSPALNLRTSVLPS